MGRLGQGNLEDRVHGCKVSEVKGRKLDEENVPFESKVLPAHAIVKGGLEKWKWAFFGYREENSTGPATHEDIT